MRVIQPIFALLIITFQVHAQVETPPTLALGVSGVLGEKGSIDIDVLAGIIFEKQAELKKQFVMKSFFKNLDQESYVLWQFAYNSLDILLESESKEAIKKNLLENAANLALVYSFSELYVQLSDTYCNDALHPLLKKADSSYRDKQFLCDATLATVKKLHKLNDLKKYEFDLNGQKIKFN